MKRMVSEEITYAYSSEKDADEHIKIMRRDYYVGGKRNWMGEIHITYRKKFC